MTGLVARVEGAPRLTRQEHAWGNEPQSIVGRVMGMETRVLLISIGGFIFILIISVLVRAFSGNKVEVKTADIVLALIPVILWLLLTGRIQELTVGDVKIVTRAVQDAAQAPVSAQVTRLPVEFIRVDPKQGLDQIPELVRRGTQALSFRLGDGGYVGEVIREYLTVLTQTGSVRFVVLDNPDNTFFGMADARQIALAVQRTGTAGSTLVPLGLGVGLDARTLALWINTADRANLARLPGFIPAEAALRVTSDKRQSLERMEKLDIETLPVVDDRRRLVGIVNRSKLTASILVDVVQRLEK